MAKTDLSIYNNDWYIPGAGVLKRLCWIWVNALFFQNPLSLSYRLKVWWLRAFGAKVGKGVVIKPSVHIKYPWKLRIGNHVWIGENVWVDNLADIKIEDHCCISQGAYLLTGNHNYRRPTFDLIVKPITLEEGAWVGAKSIVCPGVRMQSHAMLTAGSVAIGVLQAYTIYQGNPAKPIKQRQISDS
jgi:putative colanic acid biosynthesis acetyltransferase WcaF